MASPPLPPKPLDPTPSAPPAVPPLPPEYHTLDDGPAGGGNGSGSESSRPHYEDPLVAPRPHKLQPDLPLNMAQSLDDHAGRLQQSSPSPYPSSPYLSSPYPSASYPHPSSYAQPSPYASYPRGPSPLHAHRPSTDWLPPPSFPQPSFSPPHLADSFASLSIAPRSVSPLPVPAPARDGPPALTVPLPTLAVLSVQQSAIQHPSADPARRVLWCRDVLALVDRAQQLRSRASPTSTDPPLGPAQIDDPDLQKLVNVAIPIILEVSSYRSHDPLPIHVAEAVYMRAVCASTGTFPTFIRHDPRTAFRDFERAAKSGHHPAWFKLGREYENFGDIQHAKDCFERGRALGVESCVYRLGMAHLMGQLGFPPDPRAALPLLAHAATIATVEVPQPAYVYGLLLLGEFAHVSPPPELFQLPPGTTPQEEARRHLERAAYLNFAPAQYKLGHAYEFATPPFPYDALLSVQYYSLASQQGEIEADMALSKWFLCGAEGAFDKDEGLAWTFAEKAARRGLPSAEFALGYYSEVGVGGPRDIDSARKWYTRAAQHGNTDATERLQALQQDLALSREEHNKLTDTTLVRKRTQAKQRSDAVAGQRVASRPVPAEDIVKNVRKNSMMGAPMPAAAAPNPYSPRYGNGALSGSPTGPAVPLPRVDEYAGREKYRPSSGGAQGSLSSSPRPSGPPHQQSHTHSHRHSGGSPAPSGRVAGTPPLRRPAGAESKLAQNTPEQPLQRPPTKGPQTFAEMGVATQRVEDDSNCLIM